MFRIRGIGFAFLLFLVTNRALAASVSVLFVGNSLIYRNDLPTEFKTFAVESSLHVAVDVTAITPGGAFLYDHWKRGDVLTMLRARHPNFLVLQAQSTEPLSAPKQFNYYAAQFKKEADRVQAKTILFSTWARPSGDPFYKEPASGGSPFEMQKRLNVAYATLAQNIGATLAPIGLTWEQAQHVAPQIQLLDGTQHPSPAGTYLAAAVLFRTIFKSSVVGSTYLGGLPPTTAHTLQRIADAIPIANN